MLPALPSVVLRVFDLIEIAEQEIRCFKQAYRNRARALEHSFGLLMPPDGFTLLDPRVYRHHARELLQRVVDRGDVNAATEAEVMLALSTASLQAPLDATHSALYEMLFCNVMGKRLDGEPAREAWKGAADEAFVAIRRRMSPRVRRAAA